ncbi:MAG: hypothetical protein AABW73_00810 [Nanoarchaeota archaeon]
MKTVFVRNIRSVINNLPILQKTLGVGLEVSANQVTINGKEENIYDCEKVFEALEADYEIQIALLLANPEYLMETMHIRDYSRRTNIADVRARIIGTKGKTKKLMEKLSDSVMKIKGNTIYIIGIAEEIRATMTAVEKLIRGSAQGKVYGFLERSRTQHKYDNGVKVQGKQPKVKKFKKKPLMRKKDEDNNLKRSRPELYDEDDDFDQEMDEENNNGNKKATMKPMKKKASPEISNDELTKGIKNLQDPQDEGLELED